MMPLEVVEGKDFERTVKFKRSITTNLFFLYKMLRKIKRGFSPIVVIVGSQRVGKSFVALWLAQTYLHLTDKNFDPRKNTFYDPMEAIRRLGDMTNDVMIIDEGGAFLNSRDWFTRINKAMDKIVQTQGYRTNLYIIISPHLSAIDKAFQIYIDFLIRVDDRGRFKAFQVFKKYDEARREKATRRMFLDDVHIKLSSMPSEVWEDYLDYSEEKKEELRKTLLNEEGEVIADNPFEQLKAGRVF